jgi:RNA polymerase sigma-70 factor (sigma-E family)
MDEHPLAQLHADHYKPLVRLAMLFLGDLAASEEVVQDAFVNTMRRWEHIESAAKVDAYLRSAVLNGARKRLARRNVGDRLKLLPVVEIGAADARALANERESAVLAAMRALPDRQRECLALRYYLDLPEADIASALGISAGSVKTHTSRGIAALARLLEEHR